MNEPPPTIQLVADPGAAIAHTHRFAHFAMATTYEVLIQHENAGYAEQAASETFRCLDKLELELSRFIENSEISQINSLPPNQPLRLSLAAFECLELSARLSADTAGAFDITIGPLLECWMNADKSPRNPTDDEVAAARELCGAGLVHLEPSEYLVMVTGPVHIELGGVGKGYAVDQMAALLRDWDINAALIHGGSSSVLALDGPTGLAGWPLTLSNPENRSETLAYLHLHNRALSGSGLEAGLHIIDPRTGRPVAGRRAAWSAAPVAATADALSTACMVMTPAEVGDYCAAHADVGALLVAAVEASEDQGANIIRLGEWGRTDRILS